MSISKHLCLYLFIIASTAAVPAGAQIKIHKILNVEDGLVQTQVNAIHEDRNGFVWFGTFGGISRWDGREFTNFQIQDGLAALDIRTIYETEDSSLLFGTSENGFSIYRDGVFSTFNADRGLPANSVRAFYRGDDGSLSVATDNGIMVFADESFDTTTASHIMAGRSVSGIIACKSGGQYVCTYGDGVFKLHDGRTESVDPENKLPSKIIRALYEAEDGTLYISVYKGGIWLMKDGDFSPFPYNSRIAGHDVKMFCPTHDGALFLPTIEGGVATYKQGVFDVISTDNGLADPVSWCVHEGRSGVVYVGTWGGVNLYRPGRIFTLNEDTGLPEDIVGPIAETQDGTYYIGTIGGGLVQYNGRVRRVLATDDGLAHNRVWSLCAARDGTLYIGTHAGVNTLNDGTLETLYYEPRETKGRVYGIQEASDGTVYFATYGGIHTYQNGVVEPLYEETDRLRSSVYEVYEGRDGEVYFGTGKGVVVYRNGSIEIPESPVPLQNAKVWSIHENSDGTMFFGTNGSGLYIMRNSLTSSSRLDTLGVSDGLSDNTIYGILEDGDGRLYLSTHRGINVVDFSGQEPSVRQLRYSDGLASDECNQGASFKDSRGRMWFGTIRGVSCYDPARDTPNTTPPKVQFARVQLYEDDFPLTAFTPRAIFDHRENYFTFDFVGTNPAAPEKVVYRYRLSNIDRDWVESQYNFVQYRALPHDDYTFEVVARNEWGYWSTPVSLSFTIEPPFWKKWWFIVLVVVAVGGAVAFLVMNRVRHLLAIERLRTKIAADLHDDVGAGLTEISIMGEVIGQKLPDESRGLVTDELKRIGNSSRQLVASMSDIVWLVNPARDSLHDLIARLGDSYKETLNAANITFRVHNVDTLKNVRLTMERRQHVFLIFKEVINNALKYSGCSEITLEVNLSGGRLNIVVADNGKGFDTEAPTLGNGLRNIRERAEKVGARVDVVSSPEKGTTVTFRGSIR